MISIDKVNCVRFSICVIVLLLVLTGCDKGYKGNPTPKDFLGNAGADIFVLDNIVHSNAQDVDWIQGLDYTLVEQIAEITKQSSISWNFKSGTANKLSVGTKIYSTDTGFLIAIVEGVEIPYLAMYEG